MLGSNRFNLCSSWQGLFGLLWRRMLQYDRRTPIYGYEIPSGVPRGVSDAVSLMLSCHRDQHKMPTSLSPHAYYWHWESSFHSHHGLKELAQFCHVHTSSMTDSNLIDLHNPRAPCLSVHRSIRPQTLYWPLSYFGWKWH